MYESIVVAFAYYSCRLPSSKYKTILEEEKKNNAILILDWYVYTFFSIHMGMLWYVYTHSWLIVSRFIFFQNKHECLQAL